jgi:hypothetical protein
MEEKERPGLDSRYWREILSTVLLSLATIGSTWCAYQASVWGGLQDLRFNEALAYRTRSEGAATRAIQVTSFDAGMFIQYVKELSSGGDDRVARFLYQRFRPEMKRAVNAWIATRPLQNPDAPPSPFAMAEYTLELDRQSTELHERADERFAAAQEANGVTDRYVLLAVAFTSVLFFAGVGEKVWSRAATWILFAMGVSLFVGATAILATLPRQ